MLSLRYFGQNSKRKGSTSPSNFDGQLLDILFVHVFVHVLFMSFCKGPKRCYCGKFQSARRVYYFLVWYASKSFATRRLLLNIWMERSMNSIIFFWACGKRNQWLWALLSLPIFWGRWERLKQCQFSQDSVAPCSLGAVLNDQIAEVGKIFLAAIVGMVVPKNEEGQNWKRRGS